MIANAGVLADRSFAKMTKAEIDKVFEVHLHGAVNVLQPAFRWMRDNGGGRMMLTSSTSGIIGNFGQANYGAAKMALVGLTNVLAVEGAKYGIRVNAIAPVAATGLTSGGQVSGGPVMAPEKVAALIVALCAPDAGRTGNVYLAGGGWFSRICTTFTEGWATPASQIAAEEVLARLDQIDDTSAQMMLDSVQDLGTAIRKRVAD